MKWIKYLKEELIGRLEIIKPVEENIGGKFLDIGFSNDFFYDIKKVKATKAKVNKWDYIKLKRFYKEKETINKIKRQFMEWEKIFANHIPDNGIISKIYKEFTQHYNKKLNK